MIDAGVIVLFDGAASAIPTGFVRDTRFDGRLPKGALSSLGGTGGSTTHSHTGTNAHTMNSHTHTSNTETSRADNSDWKAGTGGSYSGGHSHTVNWSDATWSVTGKLQGDVTYASTSHVPLSYNFIFIRSTATNLLPANACVLSAQNQPTLSFHTGSAGKYIRGADTGANAGGTSGSATHSHSVSHTHTAMTHTHTLKTSFYTGDISANDTASGITACPGPHDHTFTISQSLTGNAYSGTCPAYDNAPLCQQISVYKNTSGSSLPLRAGMIALYLGSDLPLGWVACDGTGGTPDLNGYYVKNTASASTSVTQSGANTHAHPASNAHTHSQTHNHGGSATSSSVSGNRSVGGSYSQPGMHSHTIGNISSVTATWASASISSDSVNNEPPYILAKYIMATNAALGGSGGHVFWAFA